MKGQPAFHIANPYKECVDFIGQRQCGKTNGLTYFLAGMQARAIVFNTLGVIPADRLMKNCEMIIPEWDMDIETDRIDPRLNIAFKQACKKAWTQKSTVLIVDEIHLFCAKKKTLPNHLSLMMNLGGNHDVAMWFTSQRPAQVHNDLLAGTQHHFLFRMSTSADLDHIAKELNHDLAYGHFEKEKLIDKGVKQLADYEFLYYNSRKPLDMGVNPQIFNPLPKMF